MLLALRQERRGRTLLHGCLLADREDHAPLQLGPVAYRAPENVLGMRWSYPIDIWQTSCMLCVLLAGRDLFDTWRGSGEWSTEVHLAKMVALMGPPLAEFVSRSDTCQAYFDDAANWKRHEDCPLSDLTLEQKMEVIDSGEVDPMLDFIRGMLTWMLEERKTTKELLQHPFLQDQRTADMGDASDKGSGQDEVA